MRARNCQETRDLLPELTAGALPPDVAEEVREHLAGCTACAEEARAVGILLAARPEVPEGLAERIQGALRTELGASTPSEISKVPEKRIVPLRHRRLAPAWALSAAAVVVLSLGIGIVWDGESIPDVGSDPVQVVMEEELPESWLWDDGMVAGGPVYDDLSDEDLEALIQELER